MSHFSHDSFNKIFFIVPKYFSEPPSTTHTDSPLGNDAFKLSAILEILVEQYVWRELFTTSVVMDGEDIIPERENFLCKIHQKLFFAIIPCNQIAKLILKTRYPWQYETTF